MHKDPRQAFIAKMKQDRTDKGYSFKNMSSTKPEVFIYDEIGAWGITALDFVSELQNIKAEAFDLHISSPGGEVFDGLAIYNAILNHKADVTVYIDGLAASAASFIAMAGNKVVIAKNAEMMIHDAMGLVIGNASDMTEMITTLNRLSDNIASIYADKAGGDTKQWRSLMKSETWYSAQEAVDAGLADEVQGKPTDTETNSVTASLFKHSGRADVTPVTGSSEGKTENEDEDDLFADVDFSTMVESIKNAFKEAS